MTTSQTSTVAAYSDSDVDEIADIPWWGFPIMLIFTLIALIVFAGDWAVKKIGRISL